MFSFEHLKSSISRGFPTCCFDILHRTVLMTLIHAMSDLGMWTDTAGTNLLDSGAHFYEVYECADGGHLDPAVGLGQAGDGVDVHQL